MFTLCTYHPIPTETTPIPKLNLTGRAPPRCVAQKMMYFLIPVKFIVWKDRVQKILCVYRNTTVDLNSNNFETPANMTAWPSFHNGVAAGLRIADSSQVSSFISNWRYTCAFGCGYVLCGMLPENTKNTLSLRTGHNNYEMKVLPKFTNINTVENNWTLALKTDEQECIPVGCVPPADWPSRGRGVSAQGGCLAGGCLPRGGVYLPGGCLARGVYLPRGVPAGGVVTTPSLWTEWLTGVKT